MPLSPHTYQFLVSVFASFGSILYGYDLGVIAEVVGSSTYIDLFNPTEAETGVVVSLFTGGAFFGAMFAGPSGDYFGRRLTILIGAVIFIVGGVFQTAAQTIHWLWAGRCISGLGVGFLVMIIPVYQGEIAHPSIRGRVTALQQFMLGIGAFIAGWLSYGTFQMKGTTAQWRIPLGIQILPAVVLALLIMVFPESPRWLIDHDRAEYGLQTLARLHANGDVNDAWVRAEYAQIQESITFEHEHEAKSYMELFTNRSSFRRLFLACALQASVQMTGVSAIQYFSVTIYKQIGIDSDSALKYQAINNILALIAQASCILFIDRLGRRWPLIVGNLINSLMFLIATVLIAKFPPETNSSGTAGWGFIIVTWLFNISFSATCGPLSWIIPAEIFDTHTRSKGVSIATMTSFAFNTMIGQVTGIAITNIGWRFYVVFVVCNFTNALFFYLLLPETKKKPLEEMNFLFSNAPWIVPGSDPAKYNANLAQDLERRANELREKGEVNAAHEERENL
ncbi:MFS sugar transporter-like protein [Coniochaeta sp. 2T2.1]|nr:MFS sugar transporter-like protein [Coniochaeta sp. 2T2.1]